MSVSGLRGASADALAALREQLDGVSVADATSVGEDLFALSGLLAAEPGLRRVLTDASTEGKAKAGLARQLFEGQVGSTALDLLTDAVQRRWTATRDLGDVLEHLGVVAVVRSAGDDADRLSDELFAVGRLVEESSDLRSALSDPARSAADKGALLRQLLEGKTLPATVRLTEQATSGSHRTVNAALSDYQRTAATVAGGSVATVRTAREFDDGERARLEDALSKQYGGSVHLNVVIDPELIGGLRVEIGDDVIDGTVVSRLDDARRRLVG